jgi:DNA-directed RNA polymerase specialized sigma24 family protein
MGMDPSPTRRLDGVPGRRHPWGPSAMSNLRILVDRCISGDRSALGQLWLVVERTVSSTIRRRITSYHADAHLVDDSIQEFYMKLFLIDPPLISKFKGTEEAQFRSFSRTSADRFANRFARKHAQIQRSREDCRLLESLPDRSGPTEFIFAATIDDLTSIMGNEDKSRLFYLLQLTGIIAQSDAVGTTQGLGSGSIALIRFCPARTKRYWIKKIYEKYADRII